MTTLTANMTAKMRATSNRLTRAGPYVVCGTHLAKSASASNIPIALVHCRVNGIEKIKQQSAVSLQAEPSRWSQLTICGNGCSLHYGSLQKLRPSLLRLLSHAHLLIVQSVLVWRSRNSLFVMFSAGVVAL